MDSFEGRLAVVTGGGTGMGRELVIQLAAEGGSVATCDINPENMAETARSARRDAPADVVVTTHVADVSDEAQMNRFRDEVVAQHDGAPRQQPVARKKPARDQQHSSRQPTAVRGAPPPGLRCRAGGKGHGREHERRQHQRRDLRQQGQPPQRA